MSRVTICLLLVVASLARSENEPNEELTIPTLLGFNRHLLVRPVPTPSDQMVVNVGISLLDADVHESDNTVTLGAWLQLDWVDHRIGWSGGNVKTTRVFPGNIWTPDLSLYNRIPVTKQWVWSTPVLVYPSGKVLYVPPVSFTVRCQRQKSDSQDRITCPFKLGSWTYNVDELDLVLTNNTISTSEMIANGRWTVESATLTREERAYDCCEENYVSVLGEVVLKPQLV